jgi:hypothetical protein
MASMGDPLLCPRCLSEHVEITLMGFLGLPTDDPNRATCCNCKHRGNAGDWRMIADLRAEMEDFDDRCGPTREPAEMGWPRISFKVTGDGVQTLVQLNEDGSEEPAPPGYTLVRSADGRYLSVGIP